MKESHGGERKAMKKVRDDKNSKVYDVPWYWAQEEDMSWTAY